MPASIAATSSSESGLLQSIPVTSPANTGWICWIETAMCALLLRVLPLSVGHAATVAVPIGPVFLHRSNIPLDSVLKPSFGGACGRRSIARAATDRECDNVALPQRHLVL